MKKLAIIILSCTTMSVLAQEDRPEKGKHEEIVAQKVAFLTTKMQLTPDESKVFWPVYDQYERQLHELRDAHRKQMKEKGRDLSALSDDEIESLIDGEIEMQEKELKIRKKKHEDLKKTIGPRKVAMLYRAEREFHRQLLKKFKEDRRHP